MADYITATEGDTYAAAHLNAAAWSGATLARKTAAIAQATREIDSERWQGEKYDTFQPRQFPRLIDGALRTRTSMTNQATLTLQMLEGIVWDWDPATNAPIVPDDVKRACFEQALHLLQPDTRSGRKQAIADGVLSQSAGSVSETYKAGSGRTSPLCLSAWTIMRRFQLRSGRIV